jgi:hypothetical protein
VKPEGFWFHRAAQRSMPTLQKHGASP